jgi:hypothetical protein
VAPQRTDDTTNTISDYALVCKNSVHVFTKACSIVVSHVPIHDSSRSILMIYSLQLLTWLAPNIFFCSSNNSYNPYPQSLRVISLPPGNPFYVSSEVIQNEYQDDDDDRERFENEIHEL